MKLHKVDNKKRRLRKKLLLGEFSVLGFEVACSLSAHTDAGYEQFLDDFIDLLEGRALCMGGGASPGKFNAMCFSENRYGSATEDDRESVDHWLAAQTTVTAYSIGTLVDVNHGM